MNSKSKRFLSTLLAFTVILSLFAAMPLTASAGGEFTLVPPPTPPQGNLGSISELAKYINNFDPGGSGRLTATVSGSTITVTGNVNNARNALPFTLKYGWNMIWKATYKGNIKEDYMVQVVSEADSSGRHSEFRMEGVIESTGKGALGSKYATIRISGGKVSASGAQTAIGVYDGEVVVTGAYARVSSECGNAIFVYQGRGVTISGGQVYSGQGGISSGSAINTFLTTVKVNGGFVFALVPYLAYHTPGIYDVIHATNTSDISVSSSGIVCAFDSKFGLSEFTYVDGSSTDLWSMPAGEVAWIDGGILYGSGDLFPISGVTTYQAVTVTFNSNGGSAVEKVVLKANSKLSKPSNPTKTGYFFSGWYKDSGLTQEFNFDSTPVQRDTTLYAKWVDRTPGLIILDPSIFDFLLNQRTVTFDSKGGSAVTSQTVSKDSAITKPNDPVRLLADFEGWYTDEALTQAYNFNTPVTEDFTLYAKWRTKKIVQYDSTGGSAIEFDYNGEATPYQIIYTGSPAIQPDDPQMSGFAFAGWYKDVSDTTTYNFNTPITEHLTLYAKWTPLPPEVEPEVPSTGMDNFTETRTYSGGQFSDVDENAWYGLNDQQVIANAFEYGLMEGNSENTFNPTGNITLAEAITVAVRVHSIYATGTRFSASGGNTWYQAYVEYAIDAGMIAENDFPDYNASATRAEMAYIFSKSLPASEFAAQNTVNSLPDVNNGTPYREAIFMLYRAGVVGGNNTQGTFYPGNNIIRAEAAAIISRVIIPSERFRGRTYG